jgi:hypothetical protein
VPDQRGEGGLQGLQDDPGADRPGRQLAELVEELVEPVVDRYAQKVEDDDEERDAADPGGDPQETLPEAALVRPGLDDRGLSRDGPAPRRG